jgi:hypothetical protein
MSRNDDQGLLILNEHGGGRSTRPKDLIQAISEIEQFSVAEMNSEIPEGSLPIKTALSFGDVGVRSGLFSGLMTAVTTPLMMAAGQKLIPIFLIRYFPLPWPLPSPSVSGFFCLCH